MTFTYSLTTSIGKVRLNVTGEQSSSTSVLSDEEIQAFLDMAGGDVSIASARALMRLASDKALIAKKIKAGNYWEDSESAAKQLREQAKTFLEMANEIPADATVEMQLDAFSVRDYDTASELRDSENPL